MTTRKTSGPHGRTGGRTGRRSGDSDTRQDILDAAVELFSEKGYEGASVRAIATAAGVDPALVRHYFGDKSTLFVQSIIARTGIIDDVVGQFRGEVSGRGERIARTYLGIWENEDVRPALIALLGSVATTEDARVILREALPGALVEGLGISGRDAESVGLVGAQLIGVAMARYVVRVPMLAEPSVDELAARLGPALDLILNG